MTANFVMKILVFSILVLKSTAEYAGFDEESTKEAAKYLKQGYNPKEDPCKNFTRYACGKLFANPESETPIDEQISYLYKVIQKALEAVDIEDHTTPQYKIWVKSFYDTCLLNKSQSNNGTTAFQIYNEMVRILGSPPIFGTNKKSDEFLKKNIWYLLGFVQSRFPFAALAFKLTVQTVVNAEMGKEPVLYFVPNYQLMNPIKREEIEKTTQYLAKALKTEFNKQKISSEIDEVIKFEQELAHYLNNSAQFESYSDNYDFSYDRRMDIEESFDANYLGDLFPNISWEDYFKGLLTQIQHDNFNETSTTVTVSEQDFLGNISIVINKAKPETVYNYIFYKIFKTSYEVMTANNKCIEILYSVFQSAIVRMVFDHMKLKPLEWRYDIELIKEGIFSAARFLVAGSQWLDDDDKLKIITKINQITFYPGIPDWIVNDMEVEKRTVQFDERASLVENVFHLMKGNFERHLNYIVGIEDANNDLEPQIEFNADYFMMHIDLRFGYSFLPWYSPKYPLSVKYGQIGMTIGHELSHAFDINGIAEQPKYIKSWLSDSMLKTYDRNTACLVKQYSSFCSRERNNCISGKGTVSENFADIDGLKIAYTAFKFASVTGGKDVPLPGLTDLSDDKLFFLAYGRSACDSVENANTWFDKPDVHAPNLARLILPIKNVAQFAKAFQCPSGSVYSPENRCATFGDYD